MAGSKRPSWLTWAFGVSSFVATSSYIVIFILAVNFWDGSTSVNLNQFAITLTAIAAAEGAALIFFKGDGEASQAFVPFFLSVSMRHMVLAVLAWHFDAQVTSRTSGRTFPSGFGSVNNNDTPAAYLDVRETMRMTILLAACITDCFITLAGVGIARVTYAASKRQYRKIKDTSSSSA